MAVGAPFPTRNRPSAHTLPDPTSSILKNPPRLVQISPPEPCPGRVSRTSRGRRLRPGTSVCRPRQPWRRLSRPLRRSGGRIFRSGRSPPVVYRRSGRGGRGWGRDDWGWRRVCRRGFDGRSSRGMHIGHPNILPNILPPPLIRRRSLQYRAELARNPPVRENSPVLARFLRKSPRPGADHPRFESRLGSRDRPFFKSLRPSRARAGSAERRAAGGYALEPVFAGLGSLGVDFLARSDAASEGSSEVADRLQ